MEITVKKIKIKGVSDGCNIGDGHNGAEDLPTDGDGVVSTESADDDLRTFEGEPDVPPVVRTRAIVAQEWLAAKVRTEREQARQDALADELGKDIAAKGETRNPIRIGGGLYKTRKDRDNGTFTIIPYVAPTAIEVGS